jgi:hypothetical protein
VRENEIGTAHARHLSGTARYVGTTYKRALEKFSGRDGSTRVHLLYRLAVLADSASNFVELCPSIRGIPRIAFVVTATPLPRRRSLNWLKLVSDVEPSDKTRAETAACCFRKSAGHQ